MKKYCCILFCVLVFNTFNLCANAQSDPSLFETVINIPGDTAPSSAGAGTQVNVTDGGDLSPRFGFDALPGSEINVSGGTVGSFFEARAGSAVNISGGTIGIDFSVGGDFNDPNRAVVNISGGSFGSDFSNGSNSDVTISGGSFGRDFTAVGGANFGTSFTLVGGEFKLDGEDFLGDTITLADGSILTGTFANGSAFIFSNQFRNGSLEGFEDDQLNAVSLSRVALPTLDTAPQVFNFSTQGDAPTGLRTGQTLTAQFRELPNNFRAVDATVNLENATLGQDATFQGGELNVSRNSSIGNGTLTNGTTVNVNGGTIDNTISLNSGSVLSILDGATVVRLEANSSTINLEDGTIVSDATVTDGVVNISGGGFEARFFAEGDTIVNYSGGVLAGNLFGQDLPDFRGFAGSTLNVLGTEFFLGGNQVLLEPGQTLEIETRDTILSGVLVDGSNFELDLRRTGFNSGFFSSDATLNLTNVQSVPEPAHATVLLLGTLMSLLPRRRGSRSARAGKNR